MFSQSDSKNMPSNKSDNKANANQQVVNINLGKFRSLLKEPESCECEQDTHKQDTHKHSKEAESCECKQPKHKQDEFEKPASFKQSPFKHKGRDSSRELEREVSTFKQLKSQLQFVPAELATPPRRLIHTDSPSAVRALINWLHSANGRLQAMTYQQQPRSTVTMPVSSALNTTYAQTSLSPAVNNSNVQQMIGGRIPMGVKQNYFGLNSLLHPKLKTPTHQTVGYSSSTPPTPSAQSTSSATTPPTPGGQSTSSTGSTVTTVAFEEAAVMMVRSIFPDADVAGLKTLLSPANDELARLGLADQNSQIPLEEAEKLLVGVAQNAVQAGADQNATQFALSRASFMMQVGSSSSGNFSPQTLAPPRTPYTPQTPSTPTNQPGSTLTRQSLERFRNTQEQIQQMYNPLFVSPPPSTRRPLESPERSPPAQPSQSTPEVRPPPNTPGSTGSDSVSSGEIMSPSVSQTQPFSPLSPMNEKLRTDPALISLQRDYVQKAAALTASYDGTQEWKTQAQNLFSDMDRLIVTLRPLFGTTSDARPAAIALQGSMIELQQKVLLSKVQEQQTQQGGWAELGDSESANLGPENVEPPNIIPQVSKSQSLYTTDNPTTTIVAQVLKAQIEAGGDTMIDRADGNLPAAYAAIAIGINDQRQIKNVRLVPGSRITLGGNSDQPYELMVDGVRIKGHLFNRFGEKYSNVDYQGNYAPIVNYPYNPAWEMKSAMGGLEILP